MQITGIVFTKLFPMIIDPVFANLSRADGFYANPDYTKYSVRKLNDTYKNFSESLSSKYPGYYIDS